MDENLILTAEEYIKQIEDLNWRNAFIKLRQTILENLQPGHRETMSYGRIGYEVPPSF